MQKPDGPHGTGQSVTARPGDTADPGTGSRNDLADVAEKLTAICGKVLIGADDMRLLDEGVRRGQRPEELIWAARMLKKKLEGMRKPVAYLCNGPWGSMAGFEKFCELWPPDKFQDKPASARAWWSTRKDRPDARIVLGALAKHKASDQWREGFVPSPEKWLKGHRWNDPPPQRGGESAARKPAPPKPWVPPEERDHV